MCAMVLLSPQPPEIFSLFSFFLDLQHLLSTKVQRTPFPFIPTGLVLQNASTGKRLAVISHCLLGISKPKMHYKNIAV